MTILSSYNQRSESILYRVKIVQIHSLHNITHTALLYTSCSYASRHIYLHYNVRRLYQTLWFLMDQVNRTWYGEALWLVASEMCVQLLTLTLFGRSIFAPASIRSSIHFWWPLRLALQRGVCPDCIQYIGGKQCKQHVVGNVFAQLVLWELYNKTNLVLSVDCSLGC